MRSSEPSMALRRRVVVDHAGGAAPCGFDRADERGHRDELVVERAIELPPDALEDLAERRGATRGEACRRRAPSKGACDRPRTPGITRQPRRVDGRRPAPESLRRPARCGPLEDHVGARSTRGGSSSATVPPTSAITRPALTADRARACTSSSDTPMRCAGGALLRAPATSFSPLPVTTSEDAVLRAARSPLRARLEDAASGAEPVGSAKTPVDAAMPCAASRMASSLTPQSPPRSPSPRGAPCASCAARPPRCCRPPSCAFAFS